MSPLFSVVIDLILFKLADEEEMDNIADVFVFWSDCNNLTLSIQKYTLGYNGEMVSTVFFLDYLLTLELFKIF